MHVKDSKKRLDGRRSILASHLNFGEEARGWDFVSPGHGDVDFEALFRALNRIGYAGPLSIEWEDSGMDREYGAQDALAFVRRTDFPASSLAFDAAMQRDAAETPSSRREVLCASRAISAGEAVEDLDFGRRQREAEDVCVLGNPFRIRRPRDGHDSVLDVPAEDHLGRGHAVDFGDSYEPRVVQVDGLERAITLDLHTTAPVCLEHARIEERWAPLDLVDRR